MRNPAQHPTRADSDPSGLGVKLGSLAPAAGPPAAGPATAKLPTAPPLGGVAAGASEPAPAESEAASADVQPPDAWGDDNLLDIGLDMGPAEPAASSSRAGLRSGTTPTSQRGPSSASSAPRGGVRGAAPGSSPRGQDAEVERIAQFGLSPDSVIHAPLYALKVLRRLRVLRPLVRERRLVHEQLSAVLRQQLGEMMEGLASAAASDDNPAWIVPVRLAESKAGLCRIEAGTHRDRRAEQVAGFDKASDLEGQRRKQHERDRAMAQVQVEDALQKRAQVANGLQRLEQQLSSAHDEARAAAGGDAQFAPASHAGQLAELENRRSGLAEELKARERALKKARAMLRQRQRSVAEVDSRVAAQAAAHKGALAKMAASGKRVNDALGAAELTRMLAYQEVAAELLRSGAVSLDQEIGEKLRDIVGQLEISQVDCDQHGQALEAYDRGAVKRGIAISALLALALLVVLISTIRIG